MSVRPVALVTGAARRLGREIALDLAAHGFDLAVHYHRSQKEAMATVTDLQALGVKAEAFAADLSDEGSCLALIPAVIAHFGQLDAVINNASVFVYDQPETFGYPVLDTHWRTNTAAAILLTMALHSHLLGGSRVGCAVNLLDQKLWNPNPDYFSYTLSKAALQAATVMLAQSLAPLVRVCAVAPGVTLPSGTMSESEFAVAQRLTPLGRSATPSDIAYAVRFLIESPAITGISMLVDGGQHLLGQPRDVMFIARATESALNTP